MTKANKTKLKAFENKLLKTYKATPEQVKSLFDTITEGREKFGELFTGIGKRLTPESWVQFQTVLKGSLNDVVDRGYSVFRNNAGQLGVGKNYPPTEVILKDKTMQVNLLLWLLSFAWIIYR